MDNINQLYDGTFWINRFKEGYTCSFMVQYGSYIQGFGQEAIKGKPKRYNFYLNAISELTGVKLEKLSEEELQTALKTVMKGEYPCKIIVDINSIYALGNSNGTFWLVYRPKEKEAEKMYTTLSTEREISDYCREMGVNLPVVPRAKGGIEI